MPYIGAIETIQNKQDAVGGSEDTFQICVSLHAWFTRRSKSNKQCWVMILISSPSDNAVPTTPNWAGRVSPYLKPQDV